MSWKCRFALALALFLSAGQVAPGSAHAQSGARDVREKKATARSSERGESRGARKGGLSVGAPNAGRLEGGQRLKPNNHLVMREGARTWGLPLLTRLLRRTADRVATRHPGSVLLVGDLSKKGGGPIEGHNSHQSGRDADVGFYITNSKGKSINVRRFIAFDDKGRGRELEWARFDEARNWLLVETLLKDEAGVRYIFVSTGLRARLLAHAAKKKAPRELVDRAAAAMISPKGADMHDDHFHIRIGCPESMRGACREESGRPTASAETEAPSELTAAAPAPAAAASSDGSEATPPADRSQLAMPAPAPAIEPAPLPAAAAVDDAHAAEP